MKSNFILLVSFCLLACTDHTSHHTTSILENKSSHQIDLVYYKKGSIDSSNLIKLNVGESKDVLADNDMGKGRGMIYPVFVNFEFDSVLVKFDNNYQTWQYGYNKKGFNLKAILYDSSRSIFNEKNYLERILVDTKKRTDREYKFTFTEQDYLEAND